MHIILAIDSFKGCLTSEEVEAIFAQALIAREQRSVHFPCPTEAKACSKPLSQPCTDKSFQPKYTTR